MTVPIPERELRDYLRVFRFERDLEPELDAIAQTALDRGVDGLVALFRIAHERVARDPRISPAMEAAVLVEEVGMAVPVVAEILGIEADEVEAAVRAAWGEPDGDRDAAAGGEDRRAADGEGGPAAGAVADRLAHADTDSVPPEGPAGPGATAVVLTVVAFGVVVAVVSAVFTAAGRANLAQQGIDPTVALPVAVGLVLAGVALLRALRSDGGDPD